MKKILFAALLLSPVLFYSCKSGGGDPKAVLIQFFDALKAKDIPAAKKLATENSKDLLDLMENEMKRQKDQNNDIKFDKAKMEFGEPKIEGDKATIAVKEISSGESINFTLKKEKNDWKVAFDKATMMGNAMEKMNEKGINLNDSISNALEGVKDLNIDSLKEKMKEEMEKMDTMPKH